jgi:hypothetical protein
MVSDSFYFGPDNNFSPEQWKTLREPIYQPSVERHGHYVLSGALAESPAELIRYYKDVIRLRDQHQKRWERQPPYFWMRPLAFSAAAFEISFPWYDTWQETKPLLATLEGPGEGEVFSDLEQGWEVTIVASSDRLFIRQGDFDTGGEQTAVSCGRTYLARQIPPLRARCERILEQLRGEIGFDYWSDRQPRA